MPAHRRRVQGTTRIEARASEKRVAAAVIPIARTPRRAPTITSAPPTRRRPPTTTAPVTARGRLETLPVQRAVSTLESGSVPRAIPAARMPAPIARGAWMSISGRSAGNTPTLTIATEAPTIPARIAHRTAVPNGVWPPSRGSAACRRAGLPLTGALESSARTSRSCSRSSGRAHHARTYTSITLPPIPRSA